jgi:RNA polymerase sigma-70 factor (ECF subfamily)
MRDDDWLAEQFEENRARLRGVAFRMLGSGHEADDAVQEAWIRLSRTGGEQLENLAGWLTTVVSRVCLDLLRTRATRREDLAAEPALDGRADLDAGDPEREALLADALGPALLVVLETLTPAERVAFVLHDTFALPFEEIGPILGRTPAATRQLASRARRRVRGTEAVAVADLTRQRRVVDAFLAAARGGDMAALLSMLDPEVVLHADRTAAEMGAPVELVGAAAVAQRFAGGAQSARPALIGGCIGLVWSQGGTTKVAFDLLIIDDLIVGVEMVADPIRLEQLDITPLKKGAIGPT